MTILYRKGNSKKKLSDMGFLIKNQDVKHIMLPGIKYPFALRTNTSDEKVYKQIFVNKEYDININFQPRFIIDCGANNGFSTIYFKNRYLNSTIFAIEPDKGNFDILRYNTYLYDKIKLYRRAIWHVEGKAVKIKDSNAGKWAFQIIEANPCEEDILISTTINQLLSFSKFNVIDILKMDIEGSEKEIFSENYKYWLDKVKIIVIELHDRIIPGCSKNFFAAINRYNFKYIKKGENIIAFNQKLL